MGPSKISVTPIAKDPKAIGEIQLHTIDNVLKNWTDRIGYCIASRGSHLNEIIGRIVLSNKKKKFEKIFSFF